MIDARIAAMVNFVKNGSRVADIGADHGYLSIELVNANKACKVIATDKNPGPVAAAKKNIAAVNFEKFIEVRQGDGLNVLREDEVDTICIAGMGGSLICEILSASPKILNSAQRLILQPMNAVEKVRDWLQNNNWAVVDIDLAESNNIIYEIICADKCPKKIYSPAKKFTSPLFKKFVEQKIEKLRRILNEMQNSKTAVTSEKFLQIKNEVDHLSKLIS